MTLTCRLCERSFNEQLYVLDMFSREGKSVNAASKILSTLSIMVSENDPTSNYVCKVCFEHVEDQARFITRCRASNDKIMNNAMLTNHEYKDEIRRIMKLPIQSFYYQQHANTNGIYDALVKYMKHKKTSKIKSGFDLNQLILHYSNKHNRISLNGVNVENNLAIDNNRIPQSSSVLSMDMSSANNKIKSIVNNRIQLKAKESFIIKNGIHKQNTIISNGYQCNVNEPIIVKNTKTEHDYDGIHNEVQSSSNKVDVAEKDIIWLDDDNDDDDDDDIQIIEDVQHLPKNSVKDKEKDKTTKLNILSQKNIRPLFDQNRLLSGNTNVPKNANYLSNNCAAINTTMGSVPTEEMMVTPDMTHLSNIVTSKQSNDEFYYPNVPPTVPIEIGSSLVTPETGFHFLFSSDQTVDLTYTDKPEEKKQYSNKKTKRANSRNRPVPKKKSKKSINNQDTLDKRNRPTYIKQSIPTVTTAVKSIISVATKSRPKRASALASTSGKDKKGLWKLGKHSDYSWTVDLVKLDKQLLQCPVCNKMFCSEIDRRCHEDKHSFPNVSIDSSIDYVPKLEDTISTEQQEFLVYLNLTKRISSETNMMNTLASRTQLLKALQISGNVKRSYNCHFCKYSTSRMFILWTHMSSFHNEPDTDKKSSSFCFVCNRVLGKRSQLLKHLDRCIETNIKDETSYSQQEVKRFTCEFCNTDIKSLSHLEQHIWNHVNFQNNNS